MACNQVRQGGGSPTAEKIERRLTVSAVQSLERPAGLVQKVLAVIVREVLCADDAVKIGLHKLLHQVHCTGQL